MMRRRYFAGDRLTMRLRIRGRMPESAAVTQAVKQYKHESNPVAQWLDECAIVKPGIETSGMFVYADYERWCVRNGRQALNNVNFGKELRRLGVVGKRKTHGMVYPLGLLTPEAAAASAVNP